MRVAYISTYLPTRCGIATYTDYLIKGIREIEKRREIKVLAEEGALYREEEGFKVIPCWRRDEDYVRPILDRLEDVDVVHIQHEYKIYGLDERLMRLLERIKQKKVVTIHCIRPAHFSKEGIIEEEFISRITERVDKVVVHLPSQSSVLERFGVLMEKVICIPHGTEVTNEDKIYSRKRLGLPQGGRILLSFGFVKPHKCLHILLDALSKISEKIRGVYLFVAGGLAPNAPKEHREYAESIKRRIGEFQGRIIYPERFFPNEDVPYILGASDIVLFPYYEEDRSASGSLHLAVGAGKPVIASRIPKFEELSWISDELLVLPYNSEGIAQVVIRLFEDKDFLEYVVKHTKEFRERTSWQAVADQHLRLYREVAGWS
jgi:glycosyltransferase involved in cell wall biosynthesis